MKYEDIKYKTCMKDGNIQCPCIKDGNIQCPCIKDGNMQCPYMKKYIKKIRQNVKFREL